MKKILYLFSLCLLLLGTTNAKAAIGDQLDRTGWSVTASSWCWDSPKEGHFDQIKDGQTNFWHSNWAGTDDERGSHRGNGGAALSVVPEYLIINLGTVQTIGGFGYIPRNGGNGALKNYKIYVSETPFALAAPANTDDKKKEALSLDNALLVAEGTLENVASEQKIVTTAAVTGQYVAVVWLGSYGNPADKFANCDEFYVYEYTASLKPTLQEEINAFKAIIAKEEAGGTINPGCHTQATLDAANTAIATAQDVFDNGEESEVSAAIVALQTAVSAFNSASRNPLVTGIYKIVSALPKYYEKQGVYKAIYAGSETEYAWTTLDEDSKTFYWNVTVDGTNVTIQNAAYETYITGMATLGATGTNVTCTSLSSGQFNLNCNGVMHAGGHGEGAGVSGWITGWGAGFNSASAWRFEAVEAIPEKAESAWALQVSYMQWLAEDLPMAKPLYAGKRASTLENGKRYLIYNTCMPGGQNRTGFLYHNGSSFGLDKTLPSALKLTNNSQYRYVWTVETTETEGVYRLKGSGHEYAETHYVNLKGAVSATPQDIYITDFSASTTPVDKAGVGSRAEDEATTVANAEISSADKVWAVYNHVAFSGNDKTWNGNTDSWTTWASAHPYAFYEVHEALDVTMSAAEGVEGVDAIATFSAPYPTVIPEGVNAYWAEEGVNVEEINLNKVEAEAIPANQGVILTAATTGAIQMLPANKQAVADGSNNILGHSAGAAKTLTTSDYVLGNVDNLVAFYAVDAADLTLPANKAYLPAFESGIRKFVLNFGNEATGIESVEVAPSLENAVIYDLTGRRINKIVKSGLYIVNGKIVSVVK